MSDDWMEPDEDLAPEMEDAPEAVAVVGLAGRFPGAADVGELWRNLRGGVESVTVFTDAELLAAGVDPALLADPRYVRARAVLDGADRFDAGLFGYSPREAAVLDPQQRVFLECAWEALENAGLDPETFSGRVGVYAGAILSTYLLQNLLPGAPPGEVWQRVLANDKDTLSTRVSYELNLRGPSLTVQTSCSTSLVAVHMAQQALLDYECDAALAGGVSVRFPQTAGYLYQEDGIQSPDGHCRPFDARARGTLFGSGVGIVVLKRLSDALADGDTIHAVLRGSAVNNDGSNKMGFTAPSVDGQSEVIARALAVAGVEPETIGYVEAHGTATPLGDPIEIAGLTRAFRAAGAGRRGFCAVGSVKSNFGHLDSAAGVAGLIKTVLAVEHGEIPPSLNFESPNPQLDLANSPFFVNDRLQPWTVEGAPRRAGVSAFGIGGTNAHVIVEEAPAAPGTSPSRPWQLLVLSAGTETALDRSAELLAGHLRGETDQDLADVAFTLQNGRRALPWRRAVVCRDREEAASALPLAVSGRSRERSPEVAFLFPGAGNHALGTGCGLYEAEPVFRREIDTAAEILRPVLGEDLRGLLFPAAGADPGRLENLEVALPALLALETALGRLWMSWGIRPAALLGHSRGEYAAAHLAGVMSFEDALTLAAARGRLVEQLPRGAVLAVPLSEAEVVPLLGSRLSLAAVNGPAQCVVSGLEDAVEELGSVLAARGVDGRRLAASRPYHSREMEPLIEPFTRIVGRFTLRAPEIPFVSSMTGRWAAAEEVTDPAYWALSMRRTVRFGDALETLLAEPDRALLEVGPGRALSRLARRLCDGRNDAERVVVASLDFGTKANQPADQPADQPEPAALLQALGRLWTAGVKVDWKGFSGEERRRRVPLPTYPFERSRYWIDAPVTAAVAEKTDSGMFHLPSWRRSLPPVPVSTEPRTWVLLLDGCGLGEALALRLERAGETVVRVEPAADEVSWIGSLPKAGRPLSVVHLRSLTAEPPAGLGEARRLGLDGLDALSRGLADAGFDGVKVVAVSNGVQRATGQEELCPAKATLLGWVRTDIRRGRRSLDVVLPAPGRLFERLADRLLDELRSAAAEPVVAWRGDDRWVPALEPASLAEAPAGSWMRAGGCCLVTGEAGFEAARRLAAAGSAAPARLAWVVPVGPGAEEALQRVALLEEMGAEVLLLEADPGSVESMRAAIERVEEAWGTIHGVLALPGPGGPDDRMREALALDAALGDGRPAGVLALSSWMEPPRDLRGRSDAWAAAALVDALAQARAARGAAPAVALDWAPGADLGSAEAFEALGRVLAHPPAPQVAIALAAMEVAPEIQTQEAGAGDLPAEDAISHRIAAIWREVLGVRRVGPRDSFFDLGGDSLIALQVTSRLRESFAVELPVRALLENPTPAELRDAVEEALAAAEAAARASKAIERRRETGPAPLSFSQRRLWFLDQLEPGNPAYNLRNLARLTGPLDFAALVLAFREVARRHEILRTVFVLDRGEPAQTVLETVPEIEMPRVDLGGLPVERREEAWRSLAAEEAARRFDLRSGPLMRALLGRLGEEEHLLLLTQHHIISDGWSMGVLIRELAVLYAAFSRGQRPALAPLPLQYADFAAWQRRSLSGDVLEPSLDYWRHQLHSVPATLELPTDRPRPAAQSFHGASWPVALDPDHTGALQELARRDGATPFMALLALFQTLLLRYTGQEDLTVGTPVAGRDRKELEGLIGLFVNTVVLRGDLSSDRPGGPTFREVLGRVRRASLEAFEHQDVPLERLIEELQPDRDLARNPLFQVMFALQNTPLPEVSLARLTLRQEELRSGASMFDLTLSLRERGGVVAGFVEYSTDLFEEATAARLAGHLGRLLESAVEDPERRLSALPLLTLGEQAQLAAWNDHPMPFDLDACLHERFEAWAARIPDVPAVVCEGRSLTYGELDRRAGRLARRLRGLGVGPEVRVGLCVGRSVEMIVGVLGILKAGGAYVPLDAGYPRERLAVMMEDAGASVMLSLGRAAEDLAGPDTTVIPLDSDFEETGVAFASGTTPDSPAYVIYTSGSTGRPKGVTCTHRGVLNLMADLDRRQPLRRGDPCGLWTSISFDVSVYEIFSALCYGGSLHIPSEEERAGAETLFPWMARHGIRHIYLPPFLLADYEAWVREAGEERRTLALLLVGVEPIRERLLAGIQEAVPGLRVVNGYGPTEATVCATFYDVPAGPAPERRTPLGLPVANCRVHLLDEHLREVPVGVPGEIWIGGPGLARGYLGRPDLTADRFLPDPVGGAEPGARCYRTGDLARRLPAGHIEFLGRRDQQVKVRGFRIELREVEAHLALCPGVREAVVVVREDPREDQRLVAYVVPWEGMDAESAGPAAWRADLGARLPEFMVPSTFVVLPALPLTPSGKVDRRGLPEPDWSHVRQETGYVAPHTPVETLLAGLWAELLGRGPEAPVGAADDFFASGGHSLLATRVVSRAREIFGVELPLRTLFEARTLSALAERIQALRGSALAAPPLERADRSGPPPLSFAQQRLWFMDQLVPGGSAYNVPGAARLTGPLSPAVLARVLTEVVRRHEVLRTTFEAVDGQPVQVVADPGDSARIAPLPVVDLGGLSRSAREKELARLAMAEAALPFDLARGPLLRFTLVRLGAEKHAVLITLHHIVSDAWSMGVLFREIAALYGAFMAGEASPLPDLPVQYADFAVWQRGWLAGGVLEAELGYWKRQLAGAPAVLDLPTDRPRPATQSFRGLSRRIALPAEVVGPLEGWGKRHGVTPFMIQLGALATVLGRYSGQKDVVIGSAIAGRDRRELEELIGFFVNALALRVDLSGDPGFDRLLERVREMSLDAYAHQSLPFERLVDEVAPVRDPSHSAVFQVAFAFQNTPWEPLRLPGLSLDPLPIGSGTAKVDLVLSLLEQDGGGLAGTWDYAADLFDGATIDRLSGHLETLLAGAAADPGRPLAELPLLTSGEVRQILREWNDTQLQEGEPATLGQVFRAALERWPERTAAVFQGRSLTYRGLAARAGRLARRLRELGIGPEARVGICAEEGLERVVGVVGVYLAGGAYVPLDPAHPADRLLLMLEDSGMRVLLTQERLRGSLPDPGVAVVALDGFLEEPDGEAELPQSSAAPDNLAYIIYTSGSTGRPNGVQVSHRSAWGLIRQALLHADLDPESRVLQHLSFSFDASVLETWMALASGAALHVMDRETRMSGPALAEVIRRQGITQMVVTPPLLGTMPREEVPTLRAILLGGDRCPADLATRWAVPGRNPALLNCYGPTETTIYSSILRCAGPYRRDPTIGRPVGDTRMVVVDPHGHLAPVGVPGELWIGGAGLARGYVHRPELTARRFVPDPFSGLPGERLYRTGDLVRFLPEGEIEFLGRIDRQVKLRGLRIELGEIETALAEHPGVTECAVTVRADVPGADRALVGYLVPRGAAPETRELRAFLADRLPAYMVPGIFVSLDAMPLSPNGKIDREALPSPETETRPGDPGAAPRTPAEEALARIWAQVLGRERVGVHDNFFELGGDSILGIQVVSRAQQAGFSVTARDLFQYQTVAELAEVAGTAGATAAVTAEDAVEGAIPLTPVQRYFFDLDLADPHHFNQSLLLDLNEAVDAAVLEPALRALAARHAALRLRFERGADGEWTQTLAGDPGSSFPLTRIDLSGLQRPALESMASRIQESLDLVRGPIARAALFDLGNAGRRLFLAIHHLAVDGVSWRVLLGDLEAACRGSVPPPVPMTFPAWGTRLAEHARSGSAAAELGFWLDPERADVRPLPVDRPGGENTVASAAAVTSELDEDETLALLQDVPAVFHSRINDALLAALAEAFAGWTGESRLLVDLEGHGREGLVEGADTSRTVGWLTALYPVLLQLDRRAQDPGDRLKSLKEQLRAVPRDGVGYGVLLHLGDEAAAARLRAMPAAEVVFNYLGQLDRGLPEESLFAPAPESGGDARSRRQRRDHLLEVNGGVSGGRLRLTWTYSRNLHERSTVETLAGRFAAALRALIERSRAGDAAPAFTPSDFPEARVSQKDLDKLMSRIGKRRTPVPGKAR